MTLSNSPEIVWRDWWCDSLTLINSPVITWGSAKTGEIQKGTGGRGRDRQSVINCRKSSQIVVTFYDEFYDDFYDDL